MDGVRDAFVTGITGSIAEAVDQIVKSSKTVGADPTDLIAVDSKLKSFFNWVMRWYDDPDSFDAAVDNSA